MEYRWVYITASNVAEATALGRTLVDERLAACANVLGGMTSIYRWEGEVREEPEAALVAKTRADLVDAITARIKSLHGYTCPCVVALPIREGNPDFLAWIQEETAKP